MFLDWDHNSRGDKIVMPLRTHATKLTDLDDRQLSRFSKGLAALVMTTAYNVCRKLSHRDW